MSYTLLTLRADTEDDLAQALPMLRDAAGWTAPDILDVIGPLDISAPVLAEDGGVITPATVDERFHANLKLPDGHPECDAILAASAPFQIAPQHPRRVFA